MAKASDNAFPSILLVEQASAPATPGAGQARLYRGTDNKLYMVDEADVATQVGGTAGGGSGQGLRDFATVKRSSGTIVFNSATLATVDSTLDLVLSGAAGDVIEVGMEIAVSAASTAGYLVLDFVTVVGGSVVNSVSSEGTPSSSVSHPSWGNGNIWAASPHATFSGGKQYTLASGDVASGSVTLRLRGRCSAAMQLAAGTDPYLYLWAKNLGPVL